MQARKVSRRVAEAGLCAQHAAVIAAIDKMLIEWRPKVCYDCPAVQRCWSGALQTQLKRVTMPSNSPPNDSPDVARIPNDLLAKAFWDGPAAVTITRLSDGRFVEVSTRFLEMFGYSREEVIGTTALELGVWADPAERAETVNTLLAEGSAQRELNFLTKSGEIRITFASLRLVEDGGERFLVTQLTDVTERKRTEDSLRHLAARDELTGLYNRREMGFLLQGEIARSRRYHHFMALMILDLDRFKNVNDTYGHHVGDEVLRQVAKLMRDNIRAGDSAARFGGEELAVIMPETTGSGAFKVAERIREAVASYSFNNPQRSTKILPVRTTISIGIACFPSDADSQNALTVAADRALYRAKEAGRNRTVMYNSSVLNTQPFINHHSEE